MATESLLAPETIAPWSIAQLRTAQKDHLEQAQAIEARYGDRDIPDDEQVQIKRLLSTVEVLENREAAKAEAEGQQSLIQEKLLGLTRPRRPAMMQRAEAEGRVLSPGQQFVLSKEYLTLKNAGAFASALTRADFGVQLKEGTSLLDWRSQMQRKATLAEAADDTGGAFVTPDYRPGFVELRQREISLLPLIPRLQTTSDTVSYVKQTGFTNSAAFTAEATGDAQTGTAGTKPESALAFQTVTAPVETLAHWIPVTNQMLQDAAAMRGVIDNQLMLGLELALETQVLSGNGAAPNLTGLLNTTGINVQGKGSDSDMDALFKGALLIRTVGYGVPSAIVLNATDFGTIRLAREGVATGGYLMGPPSLVGPMSLWGIPVVISQALTQGTGLVIDAAQAAAIFDREQAAIRVGTINLQFIQNQQTILAEQRLAFAVWRPSLVTKVTGL